VPQVAIEIDPSFAPQRFRRSADSIAQAFYERTKPMRELVDATMLFSEALFRLCAGAESTSPTRADSSSFSPWSGAAAVAAARDARG
jgi:hypothetical protein